MTKCDLNGVPLLVQRIEYLEEPRIARITFFTGAQLHLDSSLLFPRALSDASRPSCEEMEVAYTILNNTVAGICLFGDFV